MMPLLPVDTLRVMHREAIGNTPYPNYFAAVPSRSGEYLPPCPDPLGLAYEVALTKFRLGEWAREAVIWFSRLGKVGMRRTA